MVCDLSLSGLVANLFWGKKKSAIIKWSAAVRSAHEDGTKDATTLQPRLSHSVFLQGRWLRVVERGHNKKGFVLNGEKRQTEENVIHSLLQEARPPSFVEQTLTGAREGSEVREGPIDCTINSQTGGISMEEIQNAARRMHREFRNAFHSTRGTLRVPWWPE